MSKKTICKEEFEKWWSKRGMFEVDPNDDIMVMKARYNSVWNQAWKICGERIKEVLEKK